MDNKKHLSRVPNLFVLGAPKCGTTALSHYLANHPNVFMSEQAGNKEPEYYASDFRFGWTALTEKSQYLALFDSAPDHVRYLGEASVSYLHSERAPREILNDSPSASFVVMIRNPLEIAQRLHNQHVKHAHETTLDFEEAWRLQESRLAGSNLPEKIRDGRVLQYGELSRIGTQLSNLFRIVSRDRVYVIVYEDFVQDTAGEYRGLREFLDLEDDGEVDFPIVNPSLSYRVAGIQRALMRIKNLRERFGIPGGLGIHKAIDRLNVKPGSMYLRPGFRRELQAYFRSEVEILSELLGRDFASWLR